MSIDLGRTTKNELAQALTNYMSTGITYKFWLSSMYQRTPPAVYNSNILKI